MRYACTVTPEDDDTGLPIASCNCTPNVAVEPAATGTPSEPSTVGALVLPMSRGPGRMVSGYEVVEDSPFASVTVTDTV